jgi:HTH-type transcriptional regulator/antitoxin HigA
MTSAKIRVEEAPARRKRAGGRPGDLDFSQPHLLRGEEEYRTAVARVDELLRAEVAEGSPEWEELEFLSVLVEAYESEHEPVEPATPREVVRFLLEQRGLSRRALYPLMGGKSRVSEFLSGKRPLSMAQLRKLSTFLHIPADVLLERGPPHT